MQDDLISRSDLLEEIKKQDTSNLTKGLVLQFVEKQPTAYDVGKVVQQLEEELELAEKEERRCLIERSQQYERAEQYALGISNALDIVRNGGKE